jgi:hypothetical protein
VRNWTVVRCRDERGHDHHGDAHEAFTSLWPEVWPTQSRQPHHSPAITLIGTRAWSIICILAVIGAGLGAGELVPSIWWAPMAGVGALLAFAGATWLAGPRWQPLYELVVCGAAFAALAGLTAQVIGS